MRKINKIIIHCSDSPDNMDIGRDEICRWHTEKGFIGPDGVKGTHDDIGYHYVIRRDGLIEIGRLEDEMGAHCAGFNNYSIGICWVGKMVMTPEQKVALQKLCISLCNKYGLVIDEIFGHCELSKNKDCPNFKYPDTYTSMKEFRKILRDKIGF